MALLVSLLDPVHRSSINLATKVLLRPHLLSKLHGLTLHWTLLLPPEILFSSILRLQPPARLLSPPLHLFSQRLVLVLVPVVTLPHQLLSSQLFWLSSSLFLLLCNRSRPQLLLNNSLFILTLRRPQLLARRTISRAWLIIRLLRPPPPHSIVNRHRINSSLSARNPQMTSWTRLRNWNTTSTGLSVVRFLLLANTKNSVRTHTSTTRLQPSASFLFNVLVFFLCVS